MNKQRILEELLGLLEAKGVTIRREPLGGGGGGLCTLKNEQIFFVDAQASLTETATLCAESVSKLVDTESIYIKPEVREFIESSGSRMA